MTQHPDPPEAQDAPPAEAAHALSAQERRRLQQGYEESLKLMQQARYDFDRAHELLFEGTLHDPGNVLYVDALLANLMRKFGGRDRVPRAAVLAENVALKKAVSEHDWAAVLRLGPDLLRHNPWAVDVLQALARACAAREYRQAELRYLQQAFEAEPADAEVQRFLAQAFADAGRFDEAIHCWHQVEAADPYDTEAPRQISQLTLDKTRHDAPAAETAEQAPAEMEEERPPPPPDHAAAPAPAAPVKKKPGKLVLTRRQLLEQAILNTPEDELSYLELAELHLAEHRTYEAMRTLLKALNVSRDLRILERLEDVTMLRAQEHIERAQRRAAAARTPDALQQVEKLKDEAARLELQIYTTRCERYPQDHRLKFQVGLRLKRVGNYRQALEPLRGGLEIPEYRAEASLEIGEILQQYKQYPRALQCYRQAVQMAAGTAPLDKIRKRALYRAGVLATSMRILDSAQQYLAELVRLDPGYKDAQTRLDKLNEIGEDA